MYETNSAHDQAVTEAHYRAVAAGEVNRSLVRGVNGQLASYTPEEYGVIRMRYSSTLTTAWGNCVMVVGLLTIMAMIPYAMMVSVDRGNGHPALWTWFLPLIFVPLVAYFARSAYVAGRAAKLRRERGLPTPTTQTIDDKWIREKLKRASDVKP